MSVSSGRQVNRDRIRRRLYSDTTDLHDISYENLEHPLKTSFLVPMANACNNVTRSELDTSTMSECPSQTPSMTSNNSDYEQLIRWSETNSSDYINAETVQNFDSLTSLINALLKSTTATLMTIKINCESEMIVTYQFMPKLKQDYMLVKIDKKYAMLMKAF